MVMWFVISVVAGYALSVPQDDRTRQRQQQDDRTRQRQPQDDRTRNRGGNASATAGATQDDKNKDVKAQPILDDDTNIPDSLLNPRWKIQRTIPITDDDLNQGSADLQRPENMKQTVEYNDTIDRYIIGNKIGGTYVGAPIMMNPLGGRKGQPPGEEYYGPSDGPGYGWRCDMDKKGTSFYGD